MAINLFGKESKDLIAPVQIKQRERILSDEEAGRVPSYAIRQKGSLYFSHRQYPATRDHPAIVVRYVGKMYNLSDGSEVRDYVSVQCINDLGLRTFKRGAFMAVAKRFLSPFGGELPDPFYTPSFTVERRKPSPTERINKTNINTKRQGGD